MIGLDIGKQNVLAILGILAGTECLRSTLAFAIHSNPMSDKLLEEEFNFYSWSNGCIMSEDDTQNKSEWW